jgi:hypothetical protein
MGTIGVSVLNLSNQGESTPPHLFIHSLNQQWFGVFGALF